jgi:circadian clock protein KaiB
MQKRSSDAIILTFRTEFVINQSNQPDHLLLESIERLLERLWPFQIQDSRISQIVQELRWLEADARASLIELPEEWKLWLFRAAHELEPQDIEEVVKLGDALSLLFHRPHNERSIDKYHFQLFVAGKTLPSMCALENLRLLCQMLDNRSHCEIIDILTHPQSAIDEKIVATPTLVRVNPLPKRRIIGDLSDLKTAVLVFRTTIPSETNV